MLAAEQSGEHFEHFLVAERLEIDLDEAGGSSPPRPVARPMRCQQQHRHDGHPFGEATDEILRTLIRPV